MNLGAAIALALFGVYAWRLGTHSRRITDLHRTWTTKNGHFHELDLFHRVAVHPHVTFAYAAWGVALLVAVMSVWTLRHKRDGARQRHQTAAA